MGWAQPPCVSLALLGASSAVIIMNFAVHCRVLKAPREACDLLFPLSPFVLKYYTANSVIFARPKPPVISYNHPPNFRSLLVKDHTHVRLPSNRGVDKFESSTCLSPTIQLWPSLNPSSPALSFLSTYPLPSAILPSPASGDYARNPHVDLA